MLVKTPNSATLLNFLKKAHDNFQPISLKIKFDKDHALHLNLIALYGSILELTGSSILLICNKLITGVPVLLRAILEAHVDLINLNNDPNYGYDLKFSFLKEWLKILDEAKKGNDYLTEISAAKNLDETITLLRMVTRP
jgi:hypothetical protein